MTSATALRVTAITGFLAVALGAFGAHGLKDLLAQNGRLANWETAVLYHLAHTVVMLFVCLRTPFFAGQWRAFFFGNLIFSGSLYVLSLTNVTKLGMITPFGGVAYLVGWLMLAFQRTPAPNTP
jgi:uncharacterized membrane protein YgdD (TMEM256/DUF423 family)